MAHNLELVGAGGSEVFLPMDIPSKAKGEMTENLYELFQFINTVIESHRKNFDPNNLNMWLNELKLHESQDPSSFRHSENVPRLIYRLFVAGADTTASTPLFSAQYMVRYPEVQKRVQEEIDRVIGSNRLPRLPDKSNLPFTEAMIAELHRCICLGPLAAFHIAGETTTFRDYTIPKNSVLVSNLYAVMNDPDVWGDPENFTPGRFLDAEGRFHEPKEFIPFGVGRRNCLGEALARQELFIFFSQLLQQFTFQKTSDDAPMPDLKPIDGAVLHPKPYQIRCIKRD